jgi:two-component system, OmpR family, sensor histidine kinase KdpD
MLAAGKRIITSGLWRVFLVIAGVGALSAIDFGYARVNNATAAFTFLLFILFVATRLGSREAIAASVAAMLAYNILFLPPIGKLSISDPQNWVALIAFLATAITASQLSASAQRRAEEAEFRRQELQRLYELSKAFMLAENASDLLDRAVSQIASAFPVSGVAIQDATTEMVHSFGDARAIVELLSCGERGRQALATGKTQTVVVSIQIEDRLLGSLGIAPGSAMSDIALQATAHLIAVTMDRARARLLSAQMEVARENERLKSTLLDALAHEFKTPLTAVKAAASTMLARSRLEPLELELTTVVEEEADRMTGLVNDATELARMDSGPVILNREPCCVPDLIRSAVKDVELMLEGRAVNVDLNRRIPEPLVDEKLARLAIRQLVSNAVKYSPAGSPIAIGGESKGSSVVVWVRNEGPAIPKSEQTRVFEKFYRGRDVRDRIPGTGMGLSITREIIHAHGGDIWVDDRTAGGVQFSFSLPV